MSSAALANWPHLEREAHVTVTAQERERAALLSLGGVWHLWRRNPSGSMPIFCGTADTREQVEAECTTKDYYICLMPHNTFMSGEAGDDPLPYLCYPKRDIAQNVRDRQLFAEIETAKAGRVQANLKLMADALRRLEAINNRMESLMPSG